MKVPNWAQDLTLKTLLYLESKGYQIEIPDIKWRHCPHNYGTSGICYQHNHITISAGKNRKEQRLVLLHEIAHWVLPDKEHHGDKFWTLAFELYKWQGLSMRYCVNRESLSNTRYPRSKTRLIKISKVMGDRAKLIGYHREYNINW
jgi:hypothetical protein